MSGHEEIYCPSNRAADCVLPFSPRVRARVSAHVYSDSRRGRLICFAVRSNEITHFPGISHAGKGGDATVAAPRARPSSARIARLPTADHRKHRHLHPRRRRQRCLCALSLGSRPCTQAHQARTRRTRGVRPPLARSRIPAWRGEHLASRKGNEAGTARRPARKRDEAVPVFHEDGGAVAARHHFDSTAFPSSGERRECVDLDTFSHKNLGQK